MSIPTVAKLLRGSDHSVKPIPAEMFAPFLLPSEELLWIGQPNAECYRRQSLRTSNAVFGCGIAICAFLGVYGLMTDANAAPNAMLLACIVPLLMCLLYGYSTPPNPQFYAMTTERLLLLCPNNEDPVAALPLSKIKRVTVSGVRNGCGTVGFNIGRFVLQSIGAFAYVDNAETVAALILDAKRKTGTVSAGLL